MITSLVIFGRIKITFNIRSVEVLLAWKEALSTVGYHPTGSDVPPSDVAFHCNTVWQSIGVINYPS